MAFSIPTIDEIQCGHILYNDYGRTTREQLEFGGAYHDQTLLFHESLENIANNRTGQDCHKALEQIDRGAQSFRVLVREILRNQHRGDRSDIVINMLNGYESDCAQAVNEIAGTQFDPVESTAQRALKRTRILDVDNGGNIAICTEASRIHKQIGYNYAHTLAAEYGLDRRLRLEKVKYELTRQVKGLF